MGEFVYAIAKSAAALLQGMGEYCLVGRARRHGRDVEANVLHALGLNDIHLSVLRAALLVRWASSIEIRSQNELTRFGFAKDYDAILTVRTDSEEHRFALEYERSPKPVRYYKDVAATLCSEARVNRVLYLVTNYDLLRYVSGFFRKAQCHVFFGLVRDWHSQLLEMPISDGHAKHSHRFREVLNGNTACVDVHSAAQ